MSTIVAISTAPGLGGIGIIRMSGDDCFNILSKIFKPKSNSEIKALNNFNYLIGRSHSTPSKIIFQKFFLDSSFHPP